MSLVQSKWQGRRAAFIAWPRWNWWSTSRFTVMESVTPSGRWHCGRTGPYPWPPSTPPRRTHAVPSVVLRLHAAVVSDVDRFAELSRTQTKGGWIEAAGLVRGPLFGGLRRADWTIL